MKSKKELAVFLSKLKTFEVPKMKYEQYSTPSEFAADFLWTAYMNNDLYNRKVIDLGCGTGILSIGASVLGAKVDAVDIDADAIETAKDNRKFAETLLNQKLNLRFFVRDVAKLDSSLKAETAIQNPPFGTKNKHIDIIFLEKALQIAPVVYSMHKLETRGYIEKYCSNKGVRCSLINTYRFNLKPTMKVHEKKNYDVAVGLWKITTV
ncbi:MAG: METTL5 family protein [Candidatus Nanoarchaeia archaeon]|nr:METTL5 family protein [Candidatus Nanoarchaeia archaeon]